MADKKTRIQKLTPMDIHNQQFKKRGLSGYDRREVDAFLDKVVNNYGDALDETVDLKNQVVELKDQVENLQDQVTIYQHNEDEAKRQIVEAKNKAQQIIANATQQADNDVEQARLDKDYERQQLETIKSDYERVKKEVAGYRNHIKDLLQRLIDNLDDEQWQKALDKYFSTERFYPPDGAEPIELTDEEEVVDEDDEDEDVDNGPEIEVNFEQDDSTSPQPMVGDSPNTKVIKGRESNNIQVQQGPTIIFPDDNKK